MTPIATAVANVLIISSQVAASQVGSSAGSFVLRRTGHETVVLPTVLLGRHPGWGAPGGKAVPARHLRSMWEAINSQGLTFDAVQTGYFAHIDQVELAAEIIDDLTPKTVMVDPVMGDTGGLYVGEDIAHAIAKTLVPRAHIITPNLWEHEWLSAAGDLPDRVEELITSYPDGEKIGVLYRSAHQNMQVSHEKFDSVPHGGGDTLAALWLANHLFGLSPEQNLARSVGGVLGILRAARKTDAGELALAREQDHLINPETLEVSDV